MITDKEIKSFWNKWDMIIISWNIVSAFYLLSIVSILLIPFVFIYELNMLLLMYPMVVPVCFLLKYVFGVKGIWFFNDTVDGDFGSEGELRKAGYLDKPKWFRFIWWWFRNHSWNYISRYNPPWNNGQAEEFRIISSTVIPEDEPNHPLRWTWCGKNGVHGFHYIAARINGEVVCRYSRASKNNQVKIGAGGDRYIFHLN